MSQNINIGDRLSFDGAPCTIRYIGDVEGTKGDWLGVEWDDPFRGKHSGEHKGKRYFTCISNQPTAGSFVRPTRPIDIPQSFLEALHQKYASEFEEEIAKRKAVNNDAEFQMNDTIQFNGKVVEEVGFEKIRKQLAELQELKVVLLDGLRIAGVLGDDGQAESRYSEELQKIERTCPKITELDLTRNLIYRWRDVHDICKQLKKLKSLKLNGNRFEKVQPGIVFNGITELHLDQTFMPWDEVSSISAQFPDLQSLLASSNGLTSITATLPIALKSVVLENNDFTSLSSLKILAELPNLTRLILRGNNIDTVFKDKSTFQFSHTLSYLDVSHNKIDSWLFINDLATAFPGLDSLRISGNPLHDRAVAPMGVTGLPEKPMTVDEAFMLTLARLENLTSLNYSKITQQDRTNGELYYLSLIGKELSASSASDEARILATHPRYSALCEIYGVPTIIRKSEGFQGTNIKPGSVAARLVTFEFYQVSSPDTAVDLTSEPASHSCLIPKTFDTYRIKGIVSQLFSLAPLWFRLVWETEEWDPVEEFNILGGEEWDSDDETDNKAENQKEGIQNNDRSEPTVVKADGSKFIRREVELVDSTRQVGFWFDENIDKPKYWCKHCQIYIRDTTFEKTQHEATGKHQGNLKRFLRDIHRNKEREERDSQRTKNEVERLRNLVGGKPAGGDATRNRPSGAAAPTNNGPRQASAEERKKQIAQLAEMGVAVPEEYRREMALAGDWETISVQRITPAEPGKDDAEAKLNIGVRKRKLENEEDEEEAQMIAQPRHKGWGNTTRDYPGAVGGDDDDLDALLMNTTTVKKTDDSDSKRTLQSLKAENEAELGNVEKTEKDPDDSDPTKILKKEEPGTKQSVEAPLPLASDPPVVFKKRKNKAPRQ
uniref:Tubulin-specific chaperone E n=1 Tax=Talaromyces marneffei PM1 TaxID=1077442 RepID=A0A093V4U3_TALMA